MEFSSFCIIILQTKSLCFRERTPIIIIILTNVFFSNAVNDLRKYFMCLIWNFGISASKFYRARKLVRIRNCCDYKKVHEHAT